MRTVADVLAATDRIAPLAGAADWDPVGLQLGDPAGPADRIGLCHEVTDDVVDAATEATVNTLVTYHPLLFQPTQALVAGSGPVGRAYRLLRAGVALLVVHTAFDVAPGGCADSLAEAIGLTNVSPFGPLSPSDGDDAGVHSAQSSQHGRGAGFVGRVGSLETTVADLATVVHRRLGVAPRIAGEGPVARVAVIPGSGGSFLDAATPVADVIVTGDVSHHRARGALDRGSAIIDPGHAATERPGIASLYASLSAALGDIVDLTTLPASPWKET